MVCATYKDVPLKEEACPSLSSFLLPTEQTVGVMAGAGTVVLDCEMQAVYLKMVKQHH